MIDVLCGLRALWGGKFSEFDPLSWPSPTMGSRTQSPIHITRQPRMSKKIPGRIIFVIGSMSEP